MSTADPNHEEGRRNLPSSSSEQGRRPLTQTQVHLSRRSRGKRALRSQVSLGDRRTLTLPFFNRTTPFERYKHPHPVEPPPSPFHFAHKKLGVPELQLREQILHEVDELLREIDKERRQALLESLPIDRALSKDDCLQLFSATGTPPAGALRGVYCWAADLDFAADAALITGASTLAQPNDEMSD